MNSKMSLYKPDWEEARQRMTDWWAGKKLDRPVASVTAPICQGQGLTYIDHTPDKYTSFDTVFHNLEYTLTHTFWGGEAFPMHRVYFGPMISKIFFGSEPHFTKQTTWYEPCYDTLDDLLGFSYLADNYWWNLLKEMTRRSVERSEGRYMVTQTLVGSFIDIIAGLIGNEKMLIAMAEEPEKLKNVRDKLSAFGARAFDELFSVTRENNGGGTVDGMKVWCPKKAATNQCDLSVMISPHMFNDLVREDLESTYAYLDYGIYHMDGEDEIRHLDTLLAIEKLRLIQWMPSLKCDRDPLNWVGLFRRIQDTGRSVLVEYCPPERVADLLKKIDRDKVFLRVNCPDEETAKQTLGILAQS